MGREADANYTEKDFLEALNLIVANAGKKAEINPVAHPRAVLLGGQSGAGKTTLHKVFIERFGKNAVIINGDSYRSLHPLYREFDRKYGPDVKVQRYEIDTSGAENTTVVNGELWVQDMDSPSGWSRYRRSE